MSIWKITADSLPEKYVDASTVEMAVTIYRTWADKVGTAYNITGMTEHLSERCILRAGK